MTVTQLAAARVNGAARCAALRESSLGSTTSALVPSRVRSTLRHSRSLSHIAEGACRLSRCELRRARARMQASAAARRPTDAARLTSATAHPSGATQPSVVTRSPNGAARQNAAIRRTTVARALRTSGEARPSAACHSPIATAQASGATRARSSVADLSSVVTPSNGVLRERDAPPKRSRAFRAAETRVNCLAVRADAPPPKSLESTAPRGRRGWRHTMRRKRIASGLTRTRGGGGARQTATGRAILMPAVCRRRESRTADGR